MVNDGWCMMHDRLYIFDRCQHGFHDRCAMVIGATLVRRCNRHMLHDGTDVRIFWLGQNDVLMMLDGMVMAGVVGRRSSSGHNQDGQHQLGLSEQIVLLMIAV